MPPKKGADPKVRSIQEQLLRAGLDPGPIDGLMGPKTKEALRQFQFQMGTPVTGEIDDTTTNNLTAFVAVIGSGAAKPLKPVQIPTQPAAKPAAPSAGGGLGGGGGGGGDKIVETTTKDKGEVKEKAPVTDAEITDWINRKYGAAYSWALDIPDIKKVLWDAARGQWGAQQIEAGIKNTGWWKANGNVERGWVEREKGDPATVVKETGRAVDAVLQAAGLAGVPMSEARAKEIVRTSGMFRWSDNNMLVWDAGTLTKAVVAEAKYDPKATLLEGDIGAGQMAAKTMASQFLVRLSDQDAFTWGKKIASGEADEDDLKVYLTNAAMGRFAGNQQISDFISKGFTPRDYFGTHLEEIASLLETSADTIDLMDPKYAKVLETTDSQGNKRPMTTGEARQFAKGLPEWKSTRNAAEEVGGLREYLLQVFGKVA